MPNREDTLWKVEHPIRKCSLLILGLLTITSRLYGDVTLGALFCDHAVLQRGQPVPIWGTAEPGEAVTVEFAGQKHSVQAGIDGKWQVQLKPMPASAIGRTLTMTGRNVVKITDVLVGEVWLASGQSNMEWSVKLTTDAEKEIASADHPTIRQFDVPLAVAATPQSATKGAWTVCSPATAGEFSAVAYFFALEIQRATGVPVGIINSTCGGTPIESWMSADTLAGDPAFKATLERWEKTLQEYPEKKAGYDAAIAKWKRSDAAAASRGKEAQVTFRKTNLPPRAPRGPGHHWTPSGLFNGMIAPLAPYAIDGAIWYQGESNVDHASEYGALLKAMIRHWRTVWQRDFPFYLVQLANFKGSPGELGPNQWPWLREAQAGVLMLQQTGMAVTIDVGTPGNIHPRNKQPVGQRLALIARRQLWHEPIEDSGPVLAGFEKEGASLRLKFSHASGLNSGGEPLTDFTIAGADGVFHPAEAWLDGETVIVSSSAVTAPVAARYGWSNAPVARLRNGDGLPASPFRTDNWLR